MRCWHEGCDTPASCWRIVSHAIGDRETRYSCLEHAWHPFYKRIGEP